MRFILGFFGAVFVATWAVCSVVAPPESPVHALGGEPVEVVVRFETETVLDRDQVFSCVYLATGGMHCFVYGSLESKAQPTAPYFGNPNTANEL